MISGEDYNDTYGDNQHLDNQTQPTYSDVIRKNISFHSSSSDFQSECLTVNTSVDSGYGTTHLQAHYIEDEGWCVFFYSDFLSMNVAVTISLKRT